MTYKFEQFNTEIVDPEIIINYDNLGINNINKTITVNIILIDSAGSKFGMVLENIPTGEDTWDSVDLESLVVQDLEKYKV